MTKHEHTAERRRLAVDTALGIASLAIAALLAWALSAFMDGWPVRSAVHADERNSSVEIVAHRRHFLMPSSVSIDLFDVRPNVTPIDLERSLFEAAAAVKDRHYKTVALARSGREVFLMSGDDFRELGQEYAAGENPVYLIRTLPEHMLTTDGRQAFPTWEGGMLGVLGKQMDDTKRLAEEWVAGRHEVTQSPSA